MSTLASVVLRDVIANLPAASIPGRIFYSTDTLVIMRDNGTTWDNVTPSATSPSGAANLVYATPNGTTGTASLRAVAPADLPVATGSTFGTVKPDGTTVTISGGVISSSGGGPSPGTPPTVVQSAISNTNATSITLTSAPVSGNLLVCIAQSGSSTAASGWTAVSSNISGTYIGLVAYKVAGASEPTTQTPIGTAGAGTVIMMWEIHGQSATPLVYGVAAEVASVSGVAYGSSATIAAPTNTLALFGLSLESASVTLNSVLNATVDKTVSPTLGTLHAGWMGHSTATTGIYGIIYAMSSNSNQRPSFLVVTS